MMFQSEDCLDLPSLGAKHAAPRTRLSLMFRFCKLCSPAVAADVALLLNALTISGLGVLVQFAYYWTFFNDGVRLDDYTVICIAVGLVYFLTARFVIGLNFDAMQQGLAAAWQSAKALAIALGIFLIGVFLAKTTATHSRGWFLLWILASCLSLALLHVAIAKTFAALIRMPDSPYRRRVAAFGAPHLLNALQAHFSVASSTGEAVVHTVSVPKNADEPAFRQAMASFIKYCRANPISEVIIALTSSDESRVLAAVNLFSSLPVDVRLAPDRAVFALASTPFLAGEKLPLLVVSSRPIGDWGKLLKELFDRVTAALLLLFMAPLFVLVASAIKLDSRGPVFFKQQRNGFNHRTFTMWKFRSMTHASEPQDGPYRQATRADPRITRVGAFLRKTSIDELPQLINVLRGEMSLVGPRPHPLTLDSQYMTLIDQYATRHAVLPGITGWAQVNGYRGETETRDKMASRVAYDLHYIRNWSLSLDAWILALTAVRGFVHKNAY